MITEAGAGLYLQNQDRKIFRSAWDKEPPEITVEEDGPVHAVIRQQGWYAAEDGERLCRYDIRIHAFRGKSYLRILHTWVLTHDSRKVQFGDISIRFPVAESIGKYRFGIDDQYREKPFETTIADNTRISLVQQDSDRFEILAWQGTKSRLLRQGTHAGGWAAVRTDNHSIAVHLRDMWQQYPAELEVAEKALAVHFWPAHGFEYKHRERPDSYGVHRWPLSDGPFMDLQPRKYVEEVMMKDREKIPGYDMFNALGLAKTHEVWLDIEAGSRSSSVLQERAARFEQPPAARADAGWIGNADVFRPFLPRDEKRYPIIENQIRARWEGNTYLQDRSHDYGWLHYGDRHSIYNVYGPTAKLGYHRNWLVSCYRAGMEPWLLWARSGDRLYFRWAEMLSRHVMDIDTVHWTSKEVFPPHYKGQFYAMSFGHYSRALHNGSRHNDPIGYNMMYYYLTGYRRSLDVLTACGERELTNDLRGGKQGRFVAVTGHNHLDMHRITWDERYWQNAFGAINTMLDAAVSEEVSATYFWEFLHDIEDFTGDSRLRSAVLNIAHKLIGKPWGEQWSYPELYIFAHAYKLTGDPKYIAWGKGKLHMRISNINLSDNEELYGRVGISDQVEYTRLMRQLPGFLYFQNKAEEEHGVIPMKTQPIRFIGVSCPVYLREDEDRDFTVRFHLNLCNPKPVGPIGDLQVTAPDGRIVARQEIVDVGRFHKSYHWKIVSIYDAIEVRVPKDNQTSIYKLDVNLPFASGKLAGTWGIESPDIKKIAYEISKFGYFGGHAFFHVPKDVKEFRIRVVPSTYSRFGQPVILGPGGKEIMRLNGMNKEWVTVNPKPEDTDEVWGIVLPLRASIEFEGLPGYVYSDRAEFFLMEDK